jgi:hypothetical protein
MALPVNTTVTPNRAGVTNRSHLRDRCRHGGELACPGVRAIELLRVVSAV